jgi:hypothetical protein
MFQCTNVLLTTSWTPIVEHIIISKYANLIAILMPHIRRNAGGPRTETIALPININKLNINNL